MHPSLSFFLTLLGFLASPSLSDPPQSQEFSDCSLKTYLCGGKTFKISYPFRIQGSPFYCGHPKFDLTCADNTTLITNINGNEYSVDSLDYNSRTITTMDLDLITADQSCPQSPINISFNTTLFDYSKNDTIITVYYNCSPTLVPFFTKLQIPSITCVPDVDNGYQSFYRFEDEPSLPMMDVLKYCNSTFIVPVDASAANNYLRNGVNDFGKAMKQGFGLSWKVGEGWCDKCVKSDGVCGNDPKEENGEACFCSNSSSVDGACVPFGAARISKKGSKAAKMIIGVGSALGISFLLVIVALYLCKNKKVSNDKNIEVFLEEYGALAPKRYSYSNVKKITRDFQEKLGQGGFGTVFKGSLSNGHLVAVKILKDTQGDGEEFINEVASICRTSHVNVVSLMGFCCEGSKRALIYDFMCNGSLEKLLYSEKPKTTLEWENLYRIAISIARGLEYLHRGCNTRIVHFDIKPHNILLDQDFCPKISDFGLAKLCQKKDSIVSIAGVRGTIGYIAPEVFSRNFGVVSSKSDVYSYGMMVLEIAGVKKNANPGDDSSEKYFPHWIYEHLNKNGNLLAYGVTAESEETVRKMTLVGLWCIQTMPQNRPSMSRVIDMLEGSVNDLQVPPQPYLSSSPLGSLIAMSSVDDICSDDSRSLIHS